MKEKGKNSEFTEADRLKRIKLRRPEINMMFFNPTWQQQHMRESLAEIKSHEVDSICATFREDKASGDLLTWITDLAHETGLRIYAAPGRVAGMFAAGPNPCSRFVQRYPESLMIKQDGSPVYGHSGLITCVNQPAFQDWFYPFIEASLRQTGVDGIFMDEPKASDIPCWCSVCQKLAGNDEAALKSLRERSLADALGKIGEVTKTVNRENTAIVMLIPRSSRSFIRRVAAQTGLDAVGFDGPVCKTKVRKIKFPFHKEWIFDSTPRILSVVREMGKRSFALVETFEIPVDSHAEFERNLIRIPQLNVDIFAFNYYGHACDEPETVMRYVWTMIKKIRRAKD